MAENAKKVKESEAVVTDAVVMSEKEVTALEKNQPIEIVQIDADVRLTHAQILELLKTDSKDLVEEQLSAEYLSGSKFVVGEEKKFVVMGVKTIKGMQGDEVTAAILLGEDGNQYLNASSIIAGEAKNLLLQGAKYPMLGLTYKGKAMAKNKFQYDDFKVSRYYQVAKK